MFRYRKTGRALRWNPNPNPYLVHQDHREAVGERGAVAAVAAARVAAAPGFTAEKSAAGVKISHDGKPFAEYVIGEANKPYLFPVFGPTGKAMTRAYPMKKVEGEQFDHYHHRGIWFGHENINGVNSWTERGTSTNGLPDECVEPSDCVAVFEGEVCDVCMCPNEAIPADQAATYQTAFDVDCAHNVACDCAPVEVTCDNGTCGLAMP